MIVVYQKMTLEELEKSAKEAKEQLAKWFVANPKRRVCNAQLWYGRTVKIRKGSINECVDAAVEAASK